MGEIKDFKNNCTGTAVEGIRAKVEDSQRSRRKRQNGMKRKKKKELDGKITLSVTHQIFSALHPTQTRHRIES